MKFGLPDETYKQIKKIIEQFSQYQFKIFGSRAKDTYKNTSDIDIAVLGNFTKEDEFRISDEIDKLNIIYKIDLVFVNENTRKELLESINKEGVDF